MITLPNLNVTWNVVYVHKKDVVPVTIALSKTGSPEQLGEQVEAYNKSSVSKSKRTGYKVMLRQLAIAMVNPNNVAGSASPVRHNGLTAACNNPALILTSMAQFLDDYNILDLHDLLYTGHTCVLFLEPDQEERGDAKEAGKTAAAAVGISASITTMATDCVVI